MSSVIEKQPKLSTFFKKAIQKNQLQHAYIFEGFSGTGKYELAKWIAQGIYCQNPHEDHSPCQECRQCLRIEKNEHPDVTTLEPDGLSIKIDQVRQIKEDFSKSGMENQGKILIVKEMDKMTVSAANSLLKFIEEPEGNVKIFLLTTEVQRLLPTIISRCQIIHFPTQKISDRLERIIEEGISEEAAHVLVHLTQDNEKVKEIYEDENFQKKIETIWQWFVFLNRKDTRSYIYVQTNIMPLISERKDAEIILELLLLLYQDLTSLYFEQDKVCAFLKYKNKLAEITWKVNETQILNGLTFILEAKKKLDANVQTQNVLEQLTIRLLTN